MYIFVCFWFSIGTAEAQLEFIIDGYEEKYINHDEGPGAEKYSNLDDASDDTYSQYMYEEPTIKALSHLYWAVDMYKISDNYAIDEFMRINECDIYKKFSDNEFEWSKIRDAAKTFIKNYKSEFPTRFAFVLPLKFSDYDKRRRAFELQEGYKINSVRRFELYASDFNTETCSNDFHVSRGYPRVINLEFSRPFNLTHVPMSFERANKYIKEKNRLFYKDYPKGARSKRAIYEYYRDAYLVMKVKIFAHGKHLGANPQGAPIIQMMGILESYSVYEDIKQTKLFYKQNYVSKKKKGKLDVRLKGQYEILREKAKGEGIFN